MGKIYAFTIFEDILFIEHTFYDNVYSKQWVILVNLNCINYQLLLFKRKKKKKTQGRKRWSPCQVLLWSSNSHRQQH